MATAPLRPSPGLAAPAAPRTAKQGAGAGGHAFAAALEGLGGLERSGGAGAPASPRAAAPHAVAPAAGEPVRGWPPLKSAVREHAAGATAKRSAGEAEREAAGDLLHLAQGAQGASAVHTAPEPRRLTAPRAANAGAAPTKPVSQQQAAPQRTAPQPAAQQAATGKELVRQSAPSLAAPSARAAQRAAFERKHGGAEDTGHEQAAAPRKHASRVHASGHEPSLVQAAPPPAQPAAQSAPPTPQQAAAPQHAGSGAAALPPSLAASVEADDSLRLVVLPNSANLRVTTPNGGDLSVHLRVRDGVTNVTVSGAGSEAAMAHSSDLRAALAGQGLALGRIERATASAAGAAEVAGPRARVRSGERGEGRSARPSRTDESVNLVATAGLARPLQ